jgi:hypothetical protein
MKQYFAAESSKSKKKKQTELGSCGYTYSQRAVSFAPILPDPLVQCKKFIKFVQPVRVYL